MHLNHEINSAKLHEIDFNHHEINCGEEYNKAINLFEYNNVYNYLLEFAKRGDLIINKNIYRHRNYNLGIIDIDDDIITIYNLDNSNCYEGYPNIPIQFLDLIINNPLYYQNISMDDYELEKSSINLDYLTVNELSMYNSKFFKINNTKCLIGFINKIKTLSEIVNIIKENIDYKSRSKLFTEKYKEYLLIYV